MPELRHSNPESPHVTPEKLTDSVDTLLVIDLDRNIIRTEVLAEIISGALDANGISKDVIERLKKETEASGGSFDHFATLRENYDDEVIDKVYAEVVEAVRARRDLPYEDDDCLFYRGVRELVAGSEEDGMKRVFVTRGGEENQTLKLAEVLGLDMSKELYSILSLDGKESKAEMCVKAYDQESGEFVFRWFHNGPAEGLRARFVVVIEDKARELLELEQLGSDKAIGYWHRTGDGMKSQALPDGAKKPDNVFEIDSLFEVPHFRNQLGAIALGGKPGWATDYRNQTREAA
jgi:hypothetical protein